MPCCMSAWSPGAARAAPIVPFADDEFRGGHVRADDADALLFEEAHHVAQHAVVTAGGDDAKDAREMAEEAEVRPHDADLWALHAAHDDEIC